LKRVLIISPYFPPVNAADMQRVRMSLPYFKQFGWAAEVVMVSPEYTDLPTDELLTNNLPVDIKIHYVKAFNKSITSKIGLGSIALRSYWFYKKRVNKLLTESHFDLIYFSTTQFPVCVLGAYWKKKFNIPYVIDMQDPWHSNYYQDKPKEQRPRKYWFSYRLNKCLEPIAIKSADGLISVSEKYISDLKERYPQIKNIPAATITFGAFKPDISIAANTQFPDLLNPENKSIVYIGRGGTDMHAAITPVFTAFKHGLINNPTFYKTLKFYFIGTSYAALGQGVKTILPLAKQLGIEDYVTEIPDRTSFYHSLATLNKATALLLPGSDDPKYTASKIYPYMLLKKPVLSIFNAQSPALKVLAEYDAPYTYSYNQTKDLEHKIAAFFGSLDHTGPIEYNQQAEENYSAETLTAKQCALLELAYNHWNLGQQK
jgi:hypothetical protein